MLLYYSRFWRDVMDRTLLWVWLSLLFGADRYVYRKVHQKYDIEEIYDFDDVDIALTKDFNDYETRNILDKNLKHAKEVVEWCEDAGVEIITLDSDNYPNQLLDLDHYPAVIYCKGKLPDTSKKLCVSVVGAREHSIYGEKIGYELGYGLTKGGALVVSGGARGIDASAQKGALYAGGETVLVLGSGIDVIYPKENKELILGAMEAGAVITEYPPSSPPNSYHFPQRNRIIAAMSDGVVVVEGGERSGSLITASIAKKIDRDVFVVPGPVDRYTSKAPNHLISEGALAVTEAIDVLEQYLDVYGDSINLTASKEKPKFKSGELYEPKHSKESFLKRLFKHGEKEGKKRESKDKLQNASKAELSLDLSALTEVQRKIYDYMEPGVAYNQDMFDELDIPISILSSQLLLMEINHFISSAPGGCYIKNTSERK
jgi:DNA processing protein